MKSLKLIAVLFLFPIGAIATDWSATGKIEINVFEGFIILALIIAGLFLFLQTLYDGIEKPEPERPPSLAELVSEEINDLQLVGPNTKVGSKLIKKKGDVETYLMLAEIDKRHIREEERAKARAKRRESRWKIALLVTAILVSAVLIWMAISAR